MIRAVAWFTAMLLTVAIGAELTYPLGVIPYAAWLGVSWVLGYRCGGYLYRALRDHHDA